MRVGFVVALALAPMAGTASSAPTVGLCVAPETSFFACQTAKRKWVSLCGVLPGSLQYRFGREYGAEFRYPEDAAAGAARFRFAHYSRFRTERREVTFSSEGVEYAVFDYTEERTRRAGVRVMMPDGKEYEFVCSGQITSRLHVLDEVLRCDTDSALNGGLCP